MRSAYKHRPPVLAPVNGKTRVYRTKSHARIPNGPARVYQFPIQRSRQALQIDDAHYVVNHRAVPLTRKLCTSVCNKYMHFTPSRSAIVNIFRLTGAPPSAGRTAVQRMKRLGCHSQFAKSKRRNRIRVIRGAAVAGCVRSCEIIHEDVRLTSRHLTSTFARILRSADHVCSVARSISPHERRHVPSVKIGESFPKYV